MRKILAMIICLMIVMTVPAMAAGELTITHKNFMVVESYSTYGYLFARVENTGDAPIAIGNGALAIFDTNDGIMETSDYVSAYPYNAILNPGESVYIRDWAVLDDGVTAADIGDWKFSIKPYDYEGSAITRIPCEVTASLNGSDSYDNYIYVTFTAPEGDVIYDAGVVVALFDANGNIIFANNDTADCGVHGGSTVTVKVYVDTDIVEHFEKNNIAPATVDAYVYFE